MIRVETRRNGTLTGPVTDWQRIVWREEQNTVTGGTITLPQSSPALAELLTASASADIVGLLITDDDLIHPTNVYQVPCYVVEERATGSDGLITIPFRLDIGLINEVPAFPNPDDPDDPWASTAYWEATAALESITASFLLGQVGASAAPTWQRFDSVVLSYVSPGPSTTYKARMEPCLDYIKTKVAGLATLHCLIVDGVGMRVWVRGIEDRPNVVFSSGLNTLTDFTWANTMPAATVIYAGGAGEGATRELATATLSTDLWARKRGLFIDRGASTGADLQAAADEAAQWSGPTLELAATETYGTRYHADFMLGDTVRAEVAGVRYTLPVTAVDTTAERGQTTRRVTLGQPRMDGREVAALRRALITTYGLQENP